MFMLILWLGEGGKIFQKNIFIKGAEFLHPKDLP